mgnify:FL=1
MLTDTQIDAYFKRIGFEGRVTNSKHTLDELVLAHQCTIPFETVTLHRRGGEPRLETELIFEKVVERELGGYCFELNKLFEELLASLGFEVRPALSRAVRGRGGRMPINHRGIIAYADEGACSVDVGFGGPMPAGALLLSHGVEQEIFGETYTPRETENSWWKIERLTRAAGDNYDDDKPVRRQIELELCTAAVEDIDFSALNLYFSQPGTLFHDHEIVNLRTRSGYVGFKDGVLTVREGGRKIVTEIDDPQKVNETLARCFGLRDIDEAVREGF